MVVLRAQIVRVVLGSNSFSWSDTRLTAAAVALFVISLTTQSLVLLFVRGYYATGNTKKPLIVNVFSSFIIILSAYILINLFKLFLSILTNLEILMRVKNVQGTTMLALPLAFAIGSIFNFILIWKLFKVDFLQGISSGIKTTFLQSITSSFIMGVVTYMMLRFFSNIFSPNTFLGILMQGLFSGIIGICVGIFVLKLFKNKELEDLSKAFHKKFWRKRVVSPEQQGL
jgi:peptidoglycan biosynthesis protein MviN/MurJ (putative lipid II flippase)